METYQAEQSTNFEVIKLPKISFESEDGYQLLSVLLKTNQDEFSDKIQKLLDAGVDEESLYNLALTYQHPERTEAVMNLAAKYKPHVKNPEQVQKEVLKILSSFEIDFLKTDLAQQLNLEIEEDRKKRIEQTEEFKIRIQDLINFFKPSPRTTKTKILNFMPVSNSHPKQSGSNFSLDNEQIIVSHLENIGNHKHEFLHGVINPIVDKLDLILSDEQKERISALSSGKMKHPKEYGKYYYSLLCEELIRTYVNVFSRGKKPEDKKRGFIEQISKIDEKKFQQILLEELKFKERCDKLGIKTLVDFKHKFSEYYDKFEKSELREIIFNLYQKYDKERKKKNINFEQFILRELPKVI